MQVDLYSSANPPVLLHADLPVVAGGYYTDENSDAGAAEVTVPELGFGGINDCVEGRLLRFRVDGSADRTAVVERISTLPASATPANRVRRLSGRDWLAEFDDALVTPPLGLDAKPQVQSVRFDWTHPDLSMPLWVRPFNMGTLYKGDKTAVLEDMGTQRIGKWGQAPRGWPDTFTGWMWERPYSGPPWNNHPIMTAWFSLHVQFVASGSFVRGANCVAGRPFIMVFTADDIGQLAFDGAVVDGGATPPAIQWQRCSSVVIPEVSAGWHTIRIKAQNRPYTQYGGQYNIGSVAFAAFQPIADITGSTLSPTPSTPFAQQQRQDTYDPVHNLVIRTARVSSSDPPVGAQMTAVDNDLMRGGGWLCIGGEHIGDNPDYGYTGGFIPPGFTVGHAFRLLLTSVQSNHLPGWTLAFNDTFDSNGNAWSKTEELTARTSETLLSVIRRWHDEGHWDVATDPSTRTLYAYRWGERGDFYLNNPPLTWDDEHVVSVTIDGER